MTEREPRDPYSITIRGSSDDLIEIEGAIDEEFGEYLGDDDDSRIITLSDGSAFQVRYGDEGIWRVTPVNIGHGSSYTKIEATSPDGDYTDRLTVRNPTPYLWVACTDPKRFHRIKP